MTRTVTTAPEGLPNLRLPSKFRMWVNNSWVKNIEEHLIYGEKPYTLKEYWVLFKWWLRKEYKKEIRKQIELKELDEKYRKWS